MYNFRFMSTIVTCLYNVMVFKEAKHSHHRIDSVSSQTKQLGMNGWSVNITERNTQNFHLFAGVSMLGNVFKFGCIRQFCSSLPSWQLLKPSHLLLFGIQYLFAHVNSSSLHAARINTVIIHSPDLQPKLHSPLSNAHALKQSGLNTVISNVLITNTNILAK
jgi:hypothetical protein